MRAVIAGLAVLGLSGPCWAADFAPYLRGSNTYSDTPGPYYDWGGFYFGGQGGYSVAGVDFGSESNVFNGLNDLLVVSPSSPVLSSASSGGASYGAFIGYNSEWDHEIVLGAELNYSHASISATSVGYATGTVLGVPAAIADTDSVRFEDFATLRARIGWAVGRFLPYAMVGAAFGRIDTTHTAVAVTGVQTESISDFTYGYAGGLGVDVAVLPSMFLRGEWEWVGFVPVSEHNDLHVSTVRGAVGMRF